MLFFSIWRQWFRTIQIKVHHPSNNYRSTLKVSRSVQLNVSLCLHLQHLSDILITLVRHPQSFAIVEHGRYRIAKSSHVKLNLSNHLFREFSQFRHVGQTCILTVLCFYINNLATTDRLGMYWQDMQQNPVVRVGDSASRRSPTADRQLQSATVLSWKNVKIAD